MICAYKVNISILSSVLFTSHLFVHMMGFIAWKPQKGLLKMREIGVHAFWHCERAFTKKNHNCMNTNFENTEKRQ